ncbi:MAG: hypothetical protein ABIH00_10675 [Armatimonadota bacterium]
MNKDRILALDFDGVLWDSAQENWVTGYITYFKYSDKLACTRKNNKKFLQGRYLARSGEDFYYLFRMLDENPDIDFRKITPEKWKEYKKKHEIAAEPFVREFYKTRKCLLQYDHKGWAMHQQPYPGIINDIKGLEKYFKHIYITSAKDTPSIKKLIKSRRIKFKVIGREHSTHKHEQLKYLKDKHGIKYENIYFIDDCMENLTPLLNTKVNIFLAGWGYNSAEDKIEAKKLGIPVVNLKDLTQKIKHLINKEKKQAKVKTKIIKINKF